MYHLSVKPISRSNGRTATAAAAYRAGAEIADLRTGELHDYTRKRDIVHSEILLPAGSPAWAQDRAALWNAAEAAEKRKDARVARDYEVAIPKELTPAQGIALVRDFSQALVDRYGVAVDLNVHRDDLKKWDGTEKGYQGYHAHVLTSTRQLGREGFGAKAEIELSDTKRKSLGLSDGAGEIERIRQLWEVTANRHLEQAHQVQRIDITKLQFIRLTLSIILSIVGRSGELWGEVGKHPPRNVKKGMVCFAALQRSTWIARVGWLCRPGTVTRCKIRLRVAS